VDKILIKKIIVFTNILIHKFKTMKKTKIQKVLAIIALWALVTTNMSSVFAANIGTGSVTWTTAFDSAIVWDNNFPGTATGTVSGIVVTADIAPTLTMEISTGTLALWTLTSAAYTTSSLNIEVWTNAINWVNVTARSSSGWLTNINDSAIQINWNNTDGSADSYKFISALNAPQDSTVIGYSQTSALNVEVLDNTTEHTIYNTTRPEQLSGVNDVTFSVSTKPNAQTAAWNYQDTITFTVVGTF